MGSQIFQAGRKVEALRPVAPVKPIQREAKPELGLSDNERVKLQQFLERHQLQELLPIFLKEGVALHDVLEMTDREMKNLGVSAYSLRKRLARVIEDHHQSSQEETTVVPEDQVQSEVLRAWQGARARSSAGSVARLAEETERRLRLEEAQKSGTRLEVLSHSSTACALPQRTDPPHQVELRSSRGAGESVGDRLGVYQLLPEHRGQGGGATYRQLHDTNDQHTY